MRSPVSNIIRTGLIAAALAAVLMLAVFSFWMFGPSLFPNFVLRHSPWLDPYVRAMAKLQMEAAPFSGRSLSEREQLTKCLKSNSPDVRNAAVILIGELALPLDVQSLLDISQDSDPRVRTAALTIISSLLNSESQNFLIIGTQDENKNVRLSALSEIVDRLHSSIS